MKKKMPKYVCTFTIYNVDNEKVMTSKIVKRDINTIITLLFKFYEGYMCRLEHNGDTYWEGVFDHGIFDALDELRNVLIAEEDADNASN